MCCLSQVARSKSTEFYEALTTGKQVRMVAEWLLNVGHDPKSEALRKWAQAEGILKA